METQSMQNNNNTPPEAPIMALNLYCMDSREKVIEKLQEAIEYIKSRTDSEFENVHRTGGMIIKIVNLEIK